MSTGLMLVYGALIAFLIFLVLSARRARKNSEATAAKYEAMMVPIEKKAVDALRSRGGKISAGERYVTVNEAGIVAARDDKKQLMAIAMADSVLVFPFSDILGAEYIETSDGRQVTSLEVRLTLADEGVYRYIFSDKAFRKGNYTGRILSEHAQSMASFIKAAIRS